MTDKKKPADKGFGIVRAVALGAFVIFAAFFLHFIAKPEGSRNMYMLEMLLYDAQVKMLPDGAASDKFVIAAADDRALQRYGRWPWDRGVIADLVETMMQRGAKGIVFDMTFSERVNRDLEEKITALDPAWVPGDAKLKAMLDKYGRKVVLGSILQSPAEVTDPAAAAAAIQAAQPKSNFMLKPVEAAAQRRTPVPYSYAGLVLPLPEFVATGADLAFFNTPPDLDGPIRNYLLLSSTKQSEDEWVLLPSLALAATQLYFDKVAKITYSTTGIEDIHVGDLAIPTSYAGLTLINYYAKSDKFNLFSIADMAAAEVKDKVVFVANTALGTWDQRVTPLEEFIPGIFVHAAMMNNILEGRFITAPVWSYLASFLFVLIPLFFIRFLFHRVPLWQGITGTAIYSVAFFLFGYFAHKAGVLIYMATPLLFLWFLTLVVYIGKYFFVDKQSSFMRNAFSKYLDPKLLSQLTGDPDQIQLYGRKKEIVALFSDIVGFTTLSESMPPEDLIKAINRLFTPATAAVLEHSGFLDKYMGDAMMALYGAPIEIANKEKEACRSAVKIMERMDIVRAEFKAEGKPDVRMGVGVNAGDAIVGNMGSEERFNYSAIGDAVNTASRMEGLTRPYGVRIIASEKIFERAQDEFLFRWLDTVQVKGKKKGVPIFELMGRLTDPGIEEKRKLKEQYEAALNPFVAGDMTACLAACEKNSFPDDKAFAFLKERALELKESGESYNGIWEFKSK
ncbi:MAG TPA: adenylate/guanylate cyclase domain-containing protein [bacterium]|nr:adenylate/guanylate cyclase domain-containing protein [bacterium]